MPPPLRDPLQDLFSEFIDRVAIPAAERLIDHLTSPPPSPRTSRRPKPPKPRLRPGKQAPKTRTGPHRTDVAPGTLPGKPTLYDVLEVAPWASVETIRAAYLSLSKRFHPDTHPGDKKAEKRMKEINEAWEVLGDKKKREKYNKTGVFK